MIAALEARPDLAQQVSQIDVTDAHDAVVLLEGDTALLRLGDQEFVERIQAYLDSGRRCASASPTSTTWTCGSTSGFT